MIFNFGGPGLSVPILNSSYPANVSSAAIGKTVTFKVVIETEGVPRTYTYQWYKNGAAVSGATSSSYSFTPTAVGTYNIYCLVSNQAGSVTSRTATLTVNRLYLYNAGDTCDSVTGGWERIKDSGITTPSTPVLTYNDTTMTASIWHAGTSNFWGGWIRPVNTFDFSKYSKLVCVATEKSGTINFGVTDANRTWMEGNWGYFHAYKGVSVGTTSVDVSSVSGNYDVIIYVYNNSLGTTAKVTVSQVYLEV